MAGDKRAHVAAPSAGKGTFVFALACALTLPNLFSQEPQPPPAPPTATPASPDTEAAKAAERRKRFEEQRRRLEDANSPRPEGVGEEVPSDPDQTLFISPAAVNMLVGESHYFTVFNIDGRTITQNTGWTVDNPNIISVGKGDELVVTAIAPGRAVLRAFIDTRAAEAVITVHGGKNLPDGTILWSAPQIPGYEVKQISREAPTAGGPFMYSVARNADGDQLMRAFSSDGRQLWMRKMPREEDVVNPAPH